MSWDIFIFSTDPRHLSAGTKPHSLGDAADVRAKISKSLPAVNWKDPAVGVLEGKGWSIEFYHQANGATQDIMLSVRGGGDPVASIVKLCKDNGWVALDSSSGKLLNLDVPSSQSWQQFQAYRDQVVASTREPQRQVPHHEHPGGFLLIGLSAIIVVTYLIKRR